MLLITSPDPISISIRIPYNSLPLVYLEYESSSDPISYFRLSDEDRSTL